GPWQRIWASADDRALKRGSIYGAAALVVVCFMYGFGGFLSIWAGFPQSSKDGSTAFFDLLGAGSDVAPSWITILAALSTVTMNEGCVDSIQNGIVDTLASRFFRGKSVWYPRVLVFIINIPIVFVSLKGYDIIILFLIGNLICTICAVPLLLGLVDRLEGYITGWSFVTGVLSGFLSIVVFGYVKVGDWYEGLRYTFVLAYDWPSFVLPLIFSFIGVMIAAFIEGSIRKALGLAYPVPLSFIPHGHEDTKTPEEQSVSSGGDVEAIHGYDQKQEVFQETSAVPVK
ncbi:hypothetical protein BGX29_002775, partial [Mortierella sp. GBA35]